MNSLTMIPYSLLPTLYRRTLERSPTQVRRAWAGLGGASTRFPLTEYARGASMEPSHHGPDSATIHVVAAPPSPARARRTGRGGTTVRDLRLRAREAARVRVLYAHDRQRKQTDLPRTAPPRW